jgi:hypothetical protein
MLGGTFGSLHTAVKDSEQAHSISSSASSVLKTHESEEDAKEQDNFMRTGTLSGSVGLVLGIAAMFGTQRLKKIAAQKKTLKNSSL